MLNIKNCGPIEFRKYIANKKIYVWGAGTALKSCLDIYFSSKKIELIMDKNSKLWGSHVMHNDEAVLLCGKESFIEHIKTHGIENSVLMITSPYYGSEIIEELDSVDELNGLECFLQVVIRNTKEWVPEYSFTEGKQKIPKKIHYIWMGDRELPDDFKSNIDTWKRHNPDYEIICWNERNYDFRKYLYMREAYDTKCFGFVVNQARLDIINQYGGIYLDTDVECVANFDKLLYDNAFFNMGCADRLNMGCGFGSISNSNIIKDMLAAFDNMHFCNENGIPARKSCSSVVNPILKEYGFELENRYQKHKGIALYPCEVMSPKTIEGMPNFISDKTVSIHQESGTWENVAEKEGTRKLSQLIRERIMIK